MKNNIILCLGAICTLTLLCSSVPMVVQPKITYAIAPLVLGALIAGGSMLAGSAISGIMNNESIEDTNDTNMANAAAANQWNYKMFKEQMDYNTQMYEDQKAYNNQIIQQMNDYNTPQNQMQRYRDAGINPYFAMGNINAGNQQSLLQATQPTAPSANPAVVSPVQAAQYDYIANAARDIGSVINDYYNNSFTAAKTQIQVIDNITRLDENIARLENMRSSTTLNKAKEKQIDEQITDLQQMRQPLLKQLDLMNKNLESDNDLQAMEKQQKSIDIRVSRLQEKYQNWFNEFSKKRGQKEIETMSAVIANTTADTALKTAQEVIAKANKFGIDLDNEQKKSLMPILIEGAKLENEQKRLDNKYGTNMWSAGARWYDKLQIRSRHNMERMYGYNRTMRW